MKKLLMKIALFAAIMIVVDFAFGMVCDYLNSHAEKGTPTECRYHIAKTSDEDIILMGSSRMHHHYVPQIIEDSLGMSCYNAGIDGNGIILAYGYLNLILERYIPKVIIYDISGFDMYIDNINFQENNFKYLDNLKEYYYNDSIQNMFKQIAPHEIKKMKSKLYRYNSKFVRILGDNIHPILHYSKGYAPLFSTLKCEPSSSMHLDSERNYQIDFIKLNYINKFIDLCVAHNIQIIFTASPVFISIIDESFYTPIKDICKKRNIQFLDFNNCTEISVNNMLFQDLSHLNHNGAKMYTSLFVSSLKNKRKR